MLKKLSTYNIEMLKKIKFEILLIFEYIKK